ncbi:MAG: hypothetical protein K9N09_01750 [Candidatus Cloacimonetes bacterium]|nr:hypothetical protein [Candidatus Cloacimonadota bacterium]
MKKTILFFLLFTAGMAFGADIMSEESFEGSFPPSGWELYKFDGDWWEGDYWTQEDYSHPGPHSGTYFAWQTEGFGEDHSWLITKGVDISSYINQQLVYWEDVGDIGYAGEHNVKISTNYSGSGDPSSANWTTLRSAIVDGGYYQRTIDISGYTGTIYIAFQYIANNAGADWAIDDVKITGDTPPPTAPANVIISHDGSNVNITWDAVTNATSYEIWSCDTPDGTFVQEIAGTFPTTTSWTKAEANAKKFYFVKAVN